MTENQPTEEFTARQHKALAALLAEPSIRKAAEASGVPERTLYAWLKDTAFAAEYRVMRRDATSQAIARIQQFSGHAAATLVQLMASPNPPAIRLAAASKILELAIKSVEVDDITARLEALEVKYAEKH